MLFISNFKKFGQILYVLLTFMVESVDKQTSRRVDSSIIKSRNALCSFGTLKSRYSQLFAASSKIINVCYYILYIYLYIYVWCVLLRKGTRTLRMFTDI
jgi:hypothetical protein